MAIGQKWTNDGQQYAIDLLVPSTRAAQSTTYHGGWGQDSTTPLVTDTGLLNANPESRTAATVSKPASDTIRLVYAIVATGNRTVQETGVFSAASAGICHIRIVHGSLALESGDQVTYTVNLQLKDVSE